MRIGLLTPYSGTNLGDGAIQHAIIENIRKRWATAEIVGITLAPADTQQRHQIRAFPIIGMPVEFYSNDAQLFRRADNARQQGDCNAKPGRIERLKGIAKAAPILGGVLRFAVRQARGLRPLLREARHLVQSYRLVSQLDLLVVSGGGQLDEEWGGPWGHPYVLFRWAVLARLANTKVAMVSVGTGQINTRLSRHFIRGALAAACYRSYRDRASKHQLGNWAFTADDACVPDLAFSLDIPSRLLCQGSRSSARIVAIVPISYGDPKHWPTHAPAAHRFYIENLTTFAHWLIGRGYRILLFVSSGADRAAARTLRERLQERYGPDLLQHVLEPPVTRSPRMLEEISKADLVVASRLHGVLLSHLLRKPVLAISWDRKINTHMDELGQSPYCVNIARADFQLLRDTFLVSRPTRSKCASISTRTFTAFSR